MKNLYQVVSNTLENDKLNDVVDNSLKLYPSYILYNIIRVTKQVEKFDLITRKTSRATYATGMICLWDSDTS